MPTPPPPLTRQEIKTAQRLYRSGLNITATAKAMKRSRHLVSEAIPQKMRREIKHSFAPPPYVPSEEDIAASTAAIREGWEDYEYRKRAAGDTSRGRDWLRYEIPEFVFSKHRNGAAM